MIPFSRNLCLKSQSLQYGKETPVNLNQLQGCANHFKEGKTSSPEVTQKMGYLRDSLSGKRGFDWAVKTRWFIRQAPLLPLTCRGERRWEREREKTSSAPEIMNWWIYASTREANWGRETWVNTSQAARSILSLDKNNFSDWNPSFGRWAKTTVGAMIGKIELAHIS